MKHPKPKEPCPRGRTVLSRRQMLESAQTAEFPFVERMPKREKSRWLKVWEAFQQYKPIQAEKGMLVPTRLAASILGVSKQRLFVLIDEGRLEIVVFNEEKHVTERSILAFCKTERKSGRPLNVDKLSVREMWDASMANARELVQGK